MKKYIKILWFQYGMASLIYLISAIIYMVYRNNNTFINKIISYNQKENFSHLTKIIRSKIHLNYFVIYNMPEGLWVLATMLVIRKMSYSRITKFFLLLFPLIFVLVIEGLQFLKITNGFYDKKDIYTSLIFFIIGLFIPKNSHNIPKNIFIVFLTYLLVLFSNT